MNQAKIIGLGNTVKTGVGSTIKSQNITKEKLKKLLPKGSAHQVTDNIIEMINRMEDDTGLEQNYLEERLLANMNVIKDLKVDMVDYINAVKYCMLKQNMSNRRAWEITFPDRLAKAEAKLAQRELEGRANSVNIDSHVSNYNKNDIVVRIDTQTAIGFDILYAPARHMALKKLIDLTQGRAAPNADGEQMTVTPHVQFLASKEIVEILKPSEESKLEIDINVNKGSIIDEYEKAIGMMAQAKMEAIAGGANMLDTINAPVRASNIIDVDVSEEVNGVAIYSNDSEPDMFDPEVHDVEVYEKYGIIVKMVDAKNTTLPNSDLSDFEARHSMRN